MSRTDAFVVANDQALAGPAFGQADLTNCERELIHLAGSIQPHGVLLVLDPVSLMVSSASENAAIVFARSVDSWVGGPLDALGGDLGECVRHLVATQTLAEPHALTCHLRQ
ncbi:MAG: hypothetical protein ABI650_03965, partial [Dokdonella sp.]